MLKSLKLFQIILRFAFLIVVGIFVAQVAIDLFIGFGVAGYQYNFWLTLIPRFLFMFLGFGIIGICMLVSSRSTSLLSIGFTRKDIQNAYALNLILFCLLFSIVTCIVGYSSVHVIGYLMKFLPNIPMFKSFIVILILSFFLTSYCSFIAASFMRLKTFYALLFHSAYFLILYMLVSRSFNAVMITIATHKVMSLTATTAIGLGLFITTYLSIGRYEVRN